MPITVANLCEHLGIPVPAKGAELVLSAVKPLRDALESDLSFLDNALYKEEARATKAAAVLVREKDAELLPLTAVALVTPQPYVAFARALMLMYPQPVPAPGVSEFAVVSASATIHPTARVEPYAVIYAGAVVGEGAHIGPHAVVGENVHIGANTRIGAHCSLLKTTVGKNCIFHPGVRTGQDGFGFAISQTVKGEPEILKVPQVGGVVIGNNVEIGANTTIDCGALGDTVIEDAVKIDNQVQIGHNVHIGRGTRIVAQVGVAGSAKLGAFNVIGGQTGIAGHIEIADKVMIAALSGVTKSIPTPGSVLAGVPAVPITEWRRKEATLARIARNIPQRPPAMPQNQPATGQKPAEKIPDADPNTPNPFA